MSKKEFTGGVGSLLGEATEQKPVKKRPGPVARGKIIEKSSQEGTKDNETRATFIVNEDLLEEIKFIAFWDRVLIKEVVAEALKEAVTKHNKKLSPEDRLKFQTFQKAKKK